MIPRGSSRLGVPSQTIPMLKKEAYPCFDQRTPLRGILPERTSELKGL